MTTVWHGLLANMAIVALFISVWSNATICGIDCSRLARRFGFGVLFGLGTIAVMLLPFEVEGGVFIDLRTTMVAVAGCFGGPVALLVTAAVATAFRIFMGGAGLFAGLAGIGIAATIGMAAYVIETNERRSLASIVRFSAAVAAGAILSAVGLPHQNWAAAFDPVVILPVLTIVFAATLMASLAIANELRRREVSEKNRVYKVVIDSLPDCLNVKDRDGRFIIANPATASLMRVANADALIGKTDFDFFPEEVAIGFQADEEAVLKTGTSTIVEQRFEHHDGLPAWLSTLKVPLVDDRGRVTGMITHNRDVTANKDLEAALSESERRAAAALTNMADGFVMFDQDLNLVFCNEQYRTMFALTADLRVPGTPASAILYASIARGELINIPTESVTDWVSTAVSRLSQRGTVQFPLFDGRWIESRTSPAADGSCFVVCSDITKGKQSEKALRDLNDRLAELAETDGLTGLLNRRAFDTILGEEIGRVGQGEGPLSLLLLDVDHFKAFNDTYGHTAGDDCLRSIATCLRVVCLRPSDRAARYGGEEMVLVLPNTAEDGAMIVAHKLQDRIRALGIIHAGSEKGIVTASIGVATLLNNTIGPDAGRLVMRADKALYVAKAAGRDVVKSWQPGKPHLIKLDDCQDENITKPLAG